MGIVYEFASLLAEGKTKGVCFDKVVTIGHQTQYLSPKQINHLTKVLGKTVNKNLEQQEFINELLKELFDAKEIDAIDYSEYEKSNILHDMNYPIPAQHHQKYDVVIDGGSLEHIFNFPVAIGNCMNLAKKGGSLFIFTTANNHMGHGFYQFSPELFYRVFRMENGYEVQSISLLKHPYPGVELSPKVQCYSVNDPADVKQRVGLVSRSPVMIMIHAIRKEIKPLWESFPIQSDYESLYKNAESTEANKNEFLSKSQAIKNFFRSILGESFWESLRKSRLQKFLAGRDQLRLFSFSNKKFYPKK